VEREVVRVAVAMAAEREVVVRAAPPVEARAAVEMGVAATAAERVVATAVEVSAFAGALARETERECVASESIDDVRPLSAAHSR